MPLWFGLLLTLIGWLIQWLLSQYTLTDLQRRRLNGLLFRFEFVRRGAIALGCKDGGEPDIEKPLKWPLGGV